MQQLSGVIPALMTPLQAGGARVDHEALAQVAAFLIAKGVNGLFIAGTTGEGPLLSLEERLHVAETTVQAANGRVPVIIHAGAITTSESIQIAEHAARAGAAGVAVVTPWYFSLDDRLLEAHYRKVAEAVPHLPVYLYNIPGAAKNEVSPALARRLAESLPNVVGIKCSAGSQLRLAEYVETGPQFAVICGTDGLAAPALAIGCRGLVSSFAGIFPEPYLEVFRAVQARDLEAARRAQCTIDRVRRAMYDGAHPSIYKVALALRGLAVRPDSRPPLRTFGSAESARLAEVLGPLGVI